MFTKFFKISLLVIVVMTLIPKERCQAQGKGKEIIISNKVGEVIDLDERNYYGLFHFSENFQSAVIVQLSNGAYTVQMTETKDRIKQLRKWPIEQGTLDKLGKYIDDFQELTPAAVDTFFTPDEDLVIGLNKEVKSVQKQSSEENRLWQLSFRAKKNPLVTIMNKQQQQWKGELVGMEADSVFLGIELSIGRFALKCICIDEIQYIIAKKKPNFGEGFGIGFLIGAGTGFIIASAKNLVPPPAGILLGFPVGLISGIAGAAGGNQQFDLSKMTHPQKISTLKKIMEF